MSNEHNLTDADADKLFRQMSKAVSSSDVEALNALVGGEDSGTEEEDAQNDEEVVPEDTPENDDSPEETGDEDEGKEGEEEEEENPEKPASSESDDPQAEIQKLREQLKEAEQRQLDLKRNAGRVPFLQSQLTKLEKKISEIASQPASIDRTKRAQKIKSVLKNLEETDPHLASTLETALLELEDDLRNEFTRGNTEVFKTLHESQQEEFLAEQAAVMDDYFPRWREVVQTPQWEKWVSTLSPGRKAMALSPHADELWEAMQHFGADMQRAAGGIPQKEEAKTPDPDAAAEAERIKAQRTNRMNSPSPNTRTPAPKKPESEMSEDEL